MELARMWRRVDAPASRNVLRITIFDAIPTQQQTPCLLSGVRALVFGARAEHSPSTGVRGGAAPHCGPSNGGPTRVHG